MISLQTRIIDRGATPRGMRKAYNAAAKEAWAETGLLFHKEMSDKRFTHRHATEAGYQKRTSKYELRKLRQFGHTNPLEFTGRTRRMVRTASITSVSKGVSVRYGGANTLNFRNPKANKPIDMAAEFRTVTEVEANELAKFFDKNLDARLNANATTN